MALKLIKKSLSKVRNIKINSFFLYNTKRKTTLLRALISNLDSNSDSDTNSDTNLDDTNLDDTNYNSFTERRDLFKKQQLEAFIAAELIKDWDPTPIYDQDADLNCDNYENSLDELSFLLLIKKKILFIKILELFIQR